MSEKPQASWVDVYESAFNNNYPLSPEKIAAIQDLIVERIPHPVAGEIKSAVLALARDAAQHTDSRKTAPSGAIIAQQMVKARHELSQQQSGRCDHCHDGWMSFRFYVDESGAIRIAGMMGHVLHPMDEMGGMPMACQCKCTRGEMHVAASVSAGRATRHELDELRDAVMRARMDWHRQRTEVKRPVDNEAARLAAQLTRHFQEQGR